MSDKSDNLNRGADMSAFEAQFDGSDNFDTLLKEQKDRDVVAQQYMQTEQEISRMQALFKRSMAEKELSYKSPQDKLRHLKDAYTAALFLETMGLLPSPGILASLESQMQEMHAVIARQNKASNAD